MPPAEILEIALRSLAVAGGATLLAAGDMGIGNTTAAAALTAALPETYRPRVADVAAQLAVGAFPLPAGSKDAVLLLTLAPGAYTAQVTGVGAGEGVALVEIYQAP